MIRTSAFQCHYDPKTRTLDYSDTDGDWLKEAYNAQGNIIKRTSNFGVWFTAEYISTGKAKHRLKRTENHLGEIRTFIYHSDSGFLQGVITTQKGQTPLKEVKHLPTKTTAHQTWIFHDVFNPQNTLLSFQRTFLRPQILPKR